MKSNVVFYVILAALIMSLIFGCLLFTPFLNEEAKGWLIYSSVGAAICLGVYLGLRDK